MTEECDIVSDLWLVNHGVSMHSSLNKAWKTKEYGDAEDAFLFEQLMETPMRLHARLGDLI